MANCTLLGKTVLFVTFRDAEAESSMPALFSSIGVEAYWASGTGYTASADSANGDAPGQKAAAEAVVAALGGTVEHFKP
jgi:hypothetical protein